MPPLICHRSDPQPNSIENHESINSCFKDGITWLEMIYVHMFIYQQFLASFEEEDPSLIH